MPRIIRTDIGDEVYYILNRANARVQIFDDEKDYQSFESILEKSVKRAEKQVP